MRFEIDSSSTKDVVRGSTPPPPPSAKEEKVGGVFKRAVQRTLKFMGLSSSKRKVVPAQSGKSTVVAQRGLGVKNPIEASPHFLEVRAGIENHLKSHPYTLTKNPQGGYELSVLVVSKKGESFVARHPITFNEGEIKLRDVSFPPNQIGSIAKDLQENESGLVDDPFFFGVADRAEAENRLRLAPQEGAWLVRYSKGNNSLVISRKTGVDTFAHEFVAGEKIEQLKRSLGPEKQATQEAAAEVTAQSIAQDYRFHPVLKGQRVFDVLQQTQATIAITRSLIPGRFSLTFKDASGVIRKFRLEVDSGAIKDERGDSFSSIDALVEHYSKEYGFLGGKKIPLDPRRPYHAVTRSRLPEGVGTPLKYDQRMVINLGSGRSSRALARKAETKGAHTEAIEYKKADDLEPLKNLTYKSILHVVGHGKMGADNISSDAGAKLHYTQLAQAIFKALQNKQPSQGQRIRISLVMCHGGTDRDQTNRSYAVKLSKELDRLGIPAEILGRTQAQLRTDTLQARGKKTFKKQVQVAPGVFETKAAGSKVSVISDRGRTQVQQVY